MANECVKLDLDNNLDRDMRRLRARGVGNFAVFYIGGNFVRVSTDSQRCTYLYSSCADDLVGIYNRHAERNDILDDIKEHLDSLSGRPLSNNDK